MIDGTVYKIKKQKFSANLQVAHEIRNQLFIWRGGGDALPQFCITMLNVSVVANAA